MKTAEEWASEAFDDNKDLWLTINSPDYLSLVKQIQLDAFKAGMTEAAEIADKSCYNGGYQFASKQILSARDRKESL